MTPPRALLSVVAGALIAAAALSCDHLDDDRVPLHPVNISFTTVADWDIYGVSGALTWRQFIKSERKPSGFPYTAMTYTGFGGVLLVGDVLGNPRAYDLSCPVERRVDVRVAIDPDDEYLAVCPKCGSRYNVFSLAGHPVSGEAADKGYALRPYRVEAGRGTDYMIIRN